jgi:chromosome segregation ATPase
MANDRLSQFEREIRAKSEERDAELAEYRERLAEAVSEQDQLRDRVAELAAVVNALRDVKPTSILALWGPAVALGAAVASAGSFVLDVTVKPIRDKADAAQADNRELSGRYGELSRKQATDEEKLRWHDEWVGSLQKALTRIDSELTEAKVKESERR